MPWVRIDDTLHDHPKVYRLPASLRLHCLGAWVLAICYASRHLTDGEVPVAWLRAEGATTRQIAALVSAGFLDKTDGDGVVWVHNFLDYNPSREQVEARREDTRLARVAAGRIGGKRSAEQRATAKQTRKQEASTGQANGKANPQANGKQNAKQTEQQNPSPVPSPTRTPSLGSTATSGAVARAREEAAPESGDWFAAAVEPVETAG